MTERQARIAVREGEPELEIIGLSICRVLTERGSPCVFALDDVEELAIAVRGRVLKLRWDAARNALVDRDWPLVVRPAVHPELVPAPALSRTRLTFRAGGGPRRQRITERTVRELRRRGFRGSVAAAGECDVDWADESFPALRGAEELRLLASSHAILDASPEEEPPHLLTRMAIACGYPVVISASAGERTSAVRSVEEWSADAYAEAILSAPPPSRGADRAGIDAVVTEIEKAFLLG